MKPIYTTIPVELCQYALVQRKTNHLLLFIYLKYIASGHVKYDKYLYKAWAVDLCLSEKTIKNCIDWMIKEKWITVNNIKKSLRIIRYKQLFRKLNLKSKSAVRYEPDDFSGFTNFCCAVVVTIYLNKLRYMNKKQQSVLIMANTSKSCSNSSRGYYVLPISYLAKCLGVSNSTANNFKKRATEVGFLEVKKQLTTITDENNNKVTKDNLAIFQREDDNPGRFRAGSKYLKKIEADLIKSHIKFKCKYSFRAEKK